MRHAIQNICSQSSETSRSVSEALFVQQKENQSESRINWIGFVAVATGALGRRDIVVARRHQDVYWSTRRGAMHESFASTYA
jgi:hypothetical protein